jgi:predicted kinase
MARAAEVVVSHSFEGSVGLSACAELALALSRCTTARAPGLDRHAALACFELPAPPAVLTSRAEIVAVDADERDAFTAEVRERVARERPFFEWTG